MTGELGAGPVRLGGRIGIKGYRIERAEPDHAGEQMRLRYPEGFRSIVDADLELRGTLLAPCSAARCSSGGRCTRKRFEPTSTCSISARRRRRAAGGSR